MFPEINALARPVVATSGNRKSLGSGNVSDSRLGADVFSSQVDEIKQDLHVRVGEAKGWPQSRPHRSGKITFAVPSPLVTIFS